VSVGFWITPVVMAGFCAFLYLTTWLERLIPLPASDEQRLAEPVDSALAVMSTVQVPDLEPQRGAEPGIAAA
jgi:hypothetical protein